MKISSLHVLCEGYGRIYNTTYSNANVDPRPSVLALGRWVNHKGTKLLCGINLNYLSDDQTLDLQKNLKTILADRNLRRRVRRLRSILPQIFDRAYRTYDQDHVRIISPSTLKFFKEPKPQALKEPVTKAIEPKFTRPDMSKAKNELGLKKPEDATKEIDQIGTDKKEVDFNKDEPKEDGKKLIEIEKEKVDKEKVGEKVGEEGEEVETEKDKNFGKSEISPEDLDEEFEDGEEDQDSGLPSK